MANPVPMGSLHENTLIAVKCCKMLQIYSLSEFIAKFVDASLWNLILKAKESWTIDTYRVLFKKYDGCCIIQHNVALLCKATASQLMAVSS